MKLKTIIITICLLSVEIAIAQSWDHIRNSGEYYYGIGVGKSEDEADRNALADLVSKIATHISSDFTQIDNMTNINGKVDHESKVINCLKTYSRLTLNNTEKLPPSGKAPNITVRRYMKRAELIHIFEDRIKRAKDLISRAEEYLQKGYIDIA